MRTSTWSMGMSRPSGTSRPSVSLANCPARNAHARRWVARSISVAVRATSGGMGRSTAASGAASMPDASTATSSSAASAASGIAPSSGRLVGGAGSDSQAASAAERASVRMLWGRTGAEDTPTCPAA